MLYDFDLVLIWGTSTGPVMPIMFSIILFLYESLIFDVCLNCSHSIVKKMCFALNAVLLEFKLCFYILSGIFFIAMHLNKINKLILNTALINETVIFHPPVTLLL